MNQIVQQIWALLDGKKTYASVLMLILWCAAVKLKIVEQDLTILACLTALAIASLRSAIGKTPSPQPSPIGMGEGGGRPSPAPAGPGEKPNG